MPLEHAGKCSGFTTVIFPFVGKTPVVMEFWEGHADGGPRQPFTTIGNWRSYGSITADGGVSTVA